MTTVEVFQINQQVNDKLTDLMNMGDSSIKVQRHKEIMELVTQLCVALVERGQDGVQVM